MIHRFGSFSTGPWQRLGRYLVFSLVTGALLVALTIRSQVAALPAPPFFGPTTKAAAPAGELAYYFPVVMTAVDLTVVPLSYGVNFITSAEAPADAQQFQNALSTGARWNRWPLYWFNIEQSENNFNWLAQDTAVQGDVSHGLQTNAILLGTPPFYLTGLQHTRGPEAARPAGLLTLTAPQTATPAGLYAPIFSDGTDVPAAGKTINENNKWARFVHLAVNRYRPGGVLAQQQGWHTAVGITHWEIWNEPDYLFFWDGTTADYARLLKVAYIVIKFTDPQAKVIFGGLSNINSSTVANPDFYQDVLAMYDADPNAAANHYYHDILATHSYFYAWNSWYHVWRAGNTLAERGLYKPIWLNENGVPAWDDYPGPVWDPQSGYRARMSEQANYIIQSAFYSTFAGADAFFHFQLYDGCGNQPPGTDFPPHQGELCDGEGQIPGTDFPCAGDANGLFRNPAGAVCFTQHPQPETARPNYQAFRVLTTYFTDVAPLWRLRPGGNTPYDGPQEWIAFFQPQTGSRILGLWARFGQDETAVVPTTNQSGHGLLVTPDGAAQPVTAQNGVFTLVLPAATNQNAPWDPALYAIGGRPYILIEQDDIPPTITVAEAAVSAGRIHLNWQGEDAGSGMAGYDVSVSVDGGPEQPLLAATAVTNLVHEGRPEAVYTFTIRGRDRAGNIGQATAVTRTPHLPQIRR